MELGQRSTNLELVLNQNQPNGLGDLSSQHGQDADNAEIQLAPGSQRGPSADSEDAEDNL